MAEKSKVVVIGGTGYIGKFIVEASAKSEHPTFALGRECTLSNSEKANILESFKSLGVNLVQGDIYDPESLVNAIKQVDVVISAVGLEQLLDQQNIVFDIKAAGNIKRFLPSEFGSDVGRGFAVEPAETVYTMKARIRDLVECQGIPYTYVCSNTLAGLVFPTFGRAQGYRSFYR